MDPKIRLPLGACEEASAVTTTEEWHVSASHANTNTYATHVMANTRDTHVPHSTPSPPSMIERTIKSEIQSASTTFQDQNEVSKHPLPTPISVTNLKAALSGHPDQHFVSQLCNNFEFGVHIGFQGHRAPRFSKNLPTAFANPEVVTSNFATEVSLGRMAGPFDTPPFKNFQVSPIGLVPKKNSNKFRTIFHLSYPKSGSTSINCSISKEDYSLQYVRIDDAIEGIQRFGQSCFLAKTDIESAFRLVPVHPDDYELLGMYWDGKYYYDKVLPFGLRSAPAIFNQLSDALEWILLNKCNISFACHILDDFLLIEPPAVSTPHNSLCQKSLENMLSIFQTINIPIAKGKTQGPLQVIEFMGILLDTVKMQARLPVDKIGRLQTALEEFQHRRSCTLKELQSLIGTLNFACRVVPPGRPFLQRMIDLTRNVKKSHHHIKLSSGFFEDLKMWKEFIYNWNGANFFLQSEWCASDTLNLHTDASGALGFGGIFGNKWFQGKWRPHQKLGQPGVSIAWQELFAIVVACQIWGDLLADQRIKFHCDNEAVVHVINSKRSPIPRVMDLMRHLTLLTLKHNMYIRAVHIAGKHNDTADAISRFQFQRFRHLAPTADTNPYQIPEKLMTL